MQRAVLAFAVIRSSLLEGHELAARAGVPFDELWTIGEPDHPDHPEGPFHENSGLRRRSRLPVTAAPEEHAADLLAVLWQARRELKALRSSLAAEPEQEGRFWERLSVEVWLVCTTPDTWFPFDFPADLLNRAARVGAQLTIEVYACDEGTAEAMIASSRVTVAAKAAEG